MKKSFIKNCHAGKTVVVGLLVTVLFFTAVGSAYPSEGTIAGNGAYSQNLLKIKLNCISQLLQKNQLNIQNNVVEKQNSGNNTAIGNTGANTFIGTGNAQSQTDIQNSGNENQATNTPCNVPSQTTSVVPCNSCTTQIPSQVPLVTQSAPVSGAAGSVPVTPASSAPATSTSTGIGQTTVPAQGVPQIPPAATVPSAPSIPSQGANNSPSIPQQAASVPTVPQVLGMSATSGDYSTLIYVFLGIVSLALSGILFTTSFNKNHI